MVGIGMCMILIGAAGLFLRLTGKLYENRLFLTAALLMGPTGIIALLSGWIVTEVGRQPYTVYGLLRTADSASPISAPGLWGSLPAFVIVYILVFTPGFIYILRIMRGDPAVDAKHPPLVRMHPNAV